MLHWVDDTRLVVQQGISKSPNPVATKPVFLEASLNECGSNYKAAQHYNETQCDRDSGMPQAAAEH